MNLERITPEKAGISSQTIINFLEKIKEKGIELHSMMLLRDGKVFAESWWAPYNKDSRHIMFSFTKSLTSTAIGFASQEGYLNTSDKLVDIFSDLLPENPSENLKKCTLKDLLTMGCGHESEIPNLGMDSENWVKDFLHHPFIYEPGTHYLYNTAGTNMLCAALKRKTGLELIEFLKPRLFQKLGFGEVPCYKLPDGTDMGGAGSRLLTEEMAKFIQFVANKGTWNGERLLNESWFDEATGNMIDTTPTQASPDWIKGYGYQFWRCVPDGIFRADGAFGQFGIVCPKENAAFIFTSAATNAQDTLTTVWEELLPNLNSEPLPENYEAQAVLSYILNNNEISAMLSTRNFVAAEKYSGKSYKAEIDGDLADFIGGAGIFASAKNLDTTITKFEVIFDNHNSKIIVHYGENSDTMPISMTSHFNSFILKDRVYGAVGAWIAPNAFEFIVRCAEAATGKKYRLIFNENTMDILELSSIPDFGGLNDEIQDKLTLELIS